MQEILAQEAKNPQSMAQSAELLKNMSPQQIDLMIKQLDEIKEEAADASTGEG